jgi:hypothetical protein
MITGRSALAQERRGAATSGTGPSAGSGSVASPPRAPRPREHDVEGEVDERRPECGVTAAARASSTARDLAGAPAVAASLVTGATNGTWSISWSEPWPQRNAGARPPSTSMGERFCCAEAIALIPFVTPGRR